MYRPKIIVKKKKVLDALGHYRYYKPAEQCVFNLQNELAYNKKGIPYPVLEIQSEKEMIRFIKDNYGNGMYVVLAIVRGRNGVWVFWKGEINDEGWMFEVKEYDKKELDELRKEMSQAETDDDRNFITEVINDVTMQAKKDNSRKKYGFDPYLKSSGRRGVWHAWDEPDEAYIPKQAFSSKRNIDTSNMSIDDMNNF